MKKVIKYEAQDGTVWDTKREATDREKLCHFREWYLGNNISTCYGDVDWEDFLAWATEHRAILKTLVLTDVLFKEG